MTTIEILLNKQAESKNFRASDCNNMCKQTIANYHLIGKPEYLALLKKFWEQTPPVCKTYTLVEMESLSSGDNNINFEYDETVKDNNIDLIPDTKLIDLNATGYYPKYMFQGFMLLYPGQITHFDFYKAKRDTNYTLAIVIRNEAMVICYADLSGI